MKNSKTVIYFLCMLTGCTVGPNYEQPQIPLPSEYKTQPSSHQKKERNLSNWWTQFDDPQLNVFIHEALSQNLDFKIAIEKINEVRAQYQIQAAELAPKIDMHAQKKRTHISQNLFEAPFLGPPNQNFYRWGFDASWEIDFFGKRRRDKQASFYEYEATKESARDLYITLLSEVACQYIEICLIKYQIDLIKREILIQQELFELTHSLTDAGLNNGIDLQTSAAICDNTSAKLPLLETALEQKMNGLATLLGKAPQNFEINLKANRIIPFSIEEIPLSLPSDLLRRRPDIRRSERELAAATAHVGSAIADLFPRFSLIGDLGLVTNQSGNWLRGQSRMWSFGPTIDWPFLYFGRIRQNIHAQNARQKQALFAYEQTILTALKEVENSLISYYKEEKRYKRLQEELKAKNHIYNLKRDLYLSGLVNFQTLLQADQDSLNTERQLILSTATLSKNRVAIYKALGGEW